jgi:type VI secretion system secreted protein Hcp
MAQVDYFLKIDGIDGESKDDTFPKWIEINSFGWGHSNAGSFASGTGGGTGKVSFQDINFTAAVNSASPSIAMYCATGQHIAWAELDVRKAGDTPQLFYKIKFTDVIVSSYRSGGHESAKDVPTDQFALNFAKIEYHYGEQDTKGKVASLNKKMGYDLRTNRTA